MSKLMHEWEGLKSARSDQGIDDRKMEWMDGEVQQAKIPQEPFLFDTFTHEHLPLPSKCSWVNVSPQETGG